MPPRRRQRRAPQNPMGRAPNMNQMMNTMANTSMGIVGISALSTVSIGALNALKPT
jgi:hypothetical protein